MEHVDLVGGQHDARRDRGADQRPAEARIEGNELVHRHLGELRRELHVDVARSLVLGEGSLVSWKSYTPKKGETLESIAKKHGMSLAQLKEVNGISSRTRNVPSLLGVPVDNTSAATMSKLPLMYAPPIAVGYRRVFYNIRKGDTQASIAKRFGVLPEDLKRWNPSSKFTAGTRVEVEVAVRSKSKTAAKGKPREQAKGKPRKSSSS